MIRKCLDWLFRPSLRHAPDRARYWACDPTTSAPEKMFETHPFFYAHGWDTQWKPWTVAYGVWEPRIKRWYWRKNSHRSLHERLDDGTVRRVE